MGSLEEHNLFTFTLSTTFPGGMIGLGQGGLRQSLILQSSLHILQQSHRTIGSGQNVLGHSAEPSQGGGGVGNGGKVTSGLTGSSPRLSEGEKVRQHLSSPNTGYGQSILAQVTFLHLVLKNVTSTPSTFRAFPNCLSAANKSTSDTKSILIIFILQALNNLTV